MSYYGYRPYGYRRRKGKSLSTLIFHLTLAIVFANAGWRVFLRESDTAKHEHPALQPGLDLTEALVEGTVTHGLPETIKILDEVVREVDPTEVPKVHQVLTNAAAERRQAVGANHRQ